MDFSLSETQTELAGLARKILAERDGPDAVGSANGSGSGRTSPRPASWRPRCRKRSAGRGSACSSSARC